MVISWWVVYNVQGYVVLNRPWAFVQWLQQAHIEEEYVQFYILSPYFQNILLTTYSLNTP